MNHFWKVKIIEMLLIAILLSSCAPVAPLAPIIDGQVEALQPGTTLWVIKGAAYERFQTFAMRYQQSDIYLFARFMNSGRTWGYSIVDAAKNMLVLYGNCATCNTMDDLVQDALKNGWNFVKPTALLPGTFYKEVDAALLRIGSWVTTPMLILPAGVLDIPEDILPAAGTIE